MPALYKKNTAPTLTPDLFQNPTSEYRGAPFWAWNNKLEETQLLRQIEVFKAMGLGGFHMHPRVGLDIPYLGDEFMALVKSCVNKAEELEMLAWLYDEDKWPSGFAGGLVTKEKRHRNKFLLFTIGNRTDDLPLAQAIEAGAPYFLAAYDINLNAEGFLASYRRIARDEKANGQKWYAFCMTANDDPWFNNEAYADLLSKETVDRFLEVTHERYKQTVGDRFGNSIPAIFTDEPNFSRRADADFATDTNDLRLPWTTGMEEDFLQEKGSSLLDSLPELFWMLPEGVLSKIKYDFTDYVCERFARSFADTCGRWCTENNLLFSGHLLSEESLFSQTKAVGEAMRHYRSYTLPGIDMLCDNTEYSTAKQAQSAAHQYGREGVLSELYGVTNWDFDFRGHKFQGDWQAALGVSVRVHHLSWVSMAGEAKRDYPASISYQSAWHGEYAYIEDHFARLNTALTRGKPVVRVGVIHPVESSWLYTGSHDKTADVRSEMEEIFQNTIRWLLFGQIDFDFISESLLPEQCAAGSAPLRVGEMAYDTIVVPNLLTIRSSTLKRLTDFQKQGGKLVFMGDCPKYVDAKPSDDARALFTGSQHCQINKESLLGALESDRLIDIRLSSGQRHPNLLYALREDNSCRWLFLCQGSRREYNDVTKPESLILRIKGSYLPTLYDTITGEIRPIPYVSRGGITEIRCERNIFESILLQLTPSGEGSYEEKEENDTVLSRFDWKTAVPYTLSEPNVLLLDRAEFSLDGEPFQSEEEILRLDTACRARLGWPRKDERGTQPWTIPAEEISHSLTLRLRIHAQADFQNTRLALENAEAAQITLNGEPVEAKPDGYYVDEAIRTVPLPTICAGENILILTLPFGLRTNTEWCYLLGDFHVCTAGCQSLLTPPADRIAFSSITGQGLPFYGANITYKTEFSAPQNKAVRIRVPSYRGALIGVAVDGKAVGRIVLPPYTLTLPSLTPGNHTLELTLFGTRHNTFGALHNTDRNERWFGPGMWRTKGDAWCYEYMLREQGLLASPVVEILG